MSQEVSNWLVHGLFHLLINGVYWGCNPLILTIDPNFQRDIQVPLSFLLGNLSSHAIHLYTQTPPVFRVGTMSSVGTCGHYE